MSRYGTLVGALQGRFGVLEFCKLELGGGGGDFLAHPGSVAKRLAKGTVSFSLVSSSLLSIDVTEKNGP